MINRSYVLAKVKKKKKTTTLGVNFICTTFYDSGIKEFLQVL